jgi:hypothetical protein
MTIKNLKNEAIQKISFISDSLSLSLESCQRSVTRFELRKKVKKGLNYFKFNFNK